MDMDNKLIRIGEINFLDTEAVVYYDEEKKDSGLISCSWQARNPNSFYQGYCNLNYETGEITYPEGTVIPEQTDRDKEIIPKVMIIGEEKLSPTIKVLKKYLESDFKRRNKG